MAVREGRLLDAVISPQKAKLFICIGWFYSAIIAILRSSIDKIDYTANSWSTETGYGRIIWTFANLMLIFLVILLQISTYGKIRKRISMAVGSVNATQGLNNLYKRAMKNSTLVAVCFTLGWAPNCILFLIQDFTHYYGPEQRRITIIFSGLALLQGFSNAIIFRARYLSSHVNRCFECLE